MFMHRKWPTWDIDAGLLLIAVDERRRVRNETIVEFTLIGAA